MLISLVLATYGRTIELIRFLDCLDHQNFRSFELIVIDQNPDDKGLCKLYNGAAAFIYPSLYEGFGIPLLEAMSCGCPIIASRIPSTLEVAKDVPIYFEPLEVEQLLAALNQILEEGRESDRVRRGHQVTQEYSWNKTAQETLGVYQSLI